MVPLGVCTHFRSLESVVQPSDPPLHAGRGGEEHDGHAATIRCAGEVRVDIQSVAGTNTGDAGDGGTVQLPTGARDQLARNLLARATTAHLRNDRPITVTVFYAWGS